jgi:hypothetical protein
MKFCPQCGASLMQGNLFCEQCGYHIDQDVSESSGASFQEIPPSNPSVQPPQPDPCQDPYNGFNYSPPIQSNGFQNKESKKGKLIPILVIIGALIIVGAGCWFAYAKFFKEKAATSVADKSHLVTTPTDTLVKDSTKKVSDIQPDQVVVTDNSALKEKPPTNVVTTTPPKPKIIEKTETPVNKTEQVVQPVEETNKENVNQPERHTNHSDSRNEDPPSVTIFQIGQFGISVLKNPKKDCSFTLNERYCITKITTDHNNSGKGTYEVGAIGIAGINGGEIKQWHARGYPDQNGLTNCKWVIRPHIILEPGQYSIIDSDRESWSKNFAGKGFVVVEGYKVK